MAIVIPFCCLTFTSVTVYPANEGENVNANWVVVNSHDPESKKSTGIWKKMKHVSDVIYFA